MSNERKGLNIMETLYILDSLGVEYVNIKKLLEAFEVRAVPKEEPLPELPEDEQPPEPPKDEGPKVYEDYKEAKKARKKGQETVHDAELGGFINV